MSSCFTDQTYWIHKQSNRGFNLRRLKIPSFQRYLLYKYISKETKKNGDLTISVTKFTRCNNLYYFTTPAGAAAGVVAGAAGATGFCAGAAGAAGFAAGC